MTFQILVKGPDGRAIAARLDVVPMRPLSKVRKSVTAWLRKNCMSVFHYCAETLPPLKTSSGHSFRVNENLQTNVLLTHFKLCIAVNFKSLQKKSAPNCDLPFGTVMTKLKLFHVVERKLHHARQTFEIDCICEFDAKFDI